MAGVLVLVGHIAGAVAAAYLSVPRTTLGDAAPAVLVELAPVAVTPESHLPNVATGPQMVEAKQEEKPKEKPEEKLEEVQEQKPDAELVLPKEKPKENDEEQKYQAPLTSAPAKSKQKADRAVAPAAGATENSTFMQARWRGAVVARLNQFKRFPPGANEGTVVVAFTVIQSGAISSVQLLKSSGNTVLDNEAVSLVWRASPFPPPPANMIDGAGIRLSAPVRYVR